MTDNKRLILISTITLVLGVILGYVIAETFFFPKVVQAPVEIREDSLEYKMINPLIYSRVSKDFYADEYKDFNNILNNYINDQLKNKLVDSAAIYFRDLNNGHWTGINENETYGPSSMLKVVLMIAYLKQSDTNPGILSKKLYYKGSDYEGQSYKPKTHMVAGYYTVEDLIKSMIVDSDNVATQVLVENNEEGFQDVYKDFRLPNLPQDISQKDFMSPRSYSVVFRALYNSTYLSHRLSELALSILSKTDFSNGIVAGTQKGLLVSHKFGEHTYNIDPNTVESRELHDCGIVYYTKNPYMLCIMTKGHDFKNLENFISGISKIVYNYVDQKNKDNTLK